MEHHHTPEQERRIREAALDETIAESFPASDPPSTLPNPDDDSLIPEGGSPADDGAAMPDAAPRTPPRD